MAGREHCPFCPTRGDDAAEVLVPQPAGQPNTPGWDVRDVPNKFPALQVEGTVDRLGDGMFDSMSGIGAHEVIIETPDHDRTLAMQSEAEIERVLWACRERMLDLKRDFRLKYILVFKNHGAAAGATLEHPHAQLIALPIVPDFVREELEGARRHYKVKERCVFCDIVHQELRATIGGRAEKLRRSRSPSRGSPSRRDLPKRHSAIWSRRRGTNESGRGAKAVLQRLNRAPETPPFNCGPPRRFLRGGRRRLPLAHRDRRS